VTSKLVVSLFCGAVHVCDAVNVSVVRAHQSFFPGT
jgi:hypothetical protein